MPVTFWVQGRPVPQGSKRHVGRGILIEQSNVKPWRTAVAWEAQQACSEILLGPVDLTLEFHLRRPKYHYGTGRNAGKVKERWKEARPIATPDL